MIPALIFAILVLAIWSFKLLLDVHLLSLKLTKGKGVLCRKARVPHRYLFVDGLF